MSYLLSGRIFQKRLVEAASEATKHMEILVEFRDVFPNGTVQDLDEKIRKWDQDPEHTESPYVEVKRGIFALTFVEV